MSSNPKTFHDAESLYNRATRSELASDFTTAFQLYLEATEAFLHLSRSPALTPTLQARCKTSAGKALERAEKIKKASERPGARIEVGAVPINWFGVDQQSYILRKSSTVNSIRYPPWTDVVALPLKPNTSYSDPDGQPSIPRSTSSSLQAYEWKRPLHDPFSSASPSCSQKASQPLTPADIEQNVVNDCSICASIAVCVQHNQKYDSKHSSAACELYTVLDYPTGYIHVLFTMAGGTTCVPLSFTGTGDPVNSLLLSSLLPGNQPGRYDIQALLNGVHRRVRSSTALAVLSVWTQCSFLCVAHVHYHFYTVHLDLWDVLPLPSYYGNTGAPPPPSHYLSGKYFWSSSSSLILPGLGFNVILLLLLLLLTLPIWEIFLLLLLLHLATAFGNIHGLCVLTVGTDAKTIWKIEGAKLLPSHNYAVVDVRETEDERWMTLLDSRVPAASQPVRGETRARARARIRIHACWTCGGMIYAQQFEGVYVSWDPGLFKSAWNGTNDTHVLQRRVWKPENADDKVSVTLHVSGSCIVVVTMAGSRTTFPLDIEKDIWVLLTRHLTDTRRAAEFVSLTVHAEDEDDWSALCGQRTRLNILQGTYTTSSHVLVRSRVRDWYPQTTTPLARTPAPSTSSKSPTPRTSPPPPAQISGALSILASYDGPFDDVFFSVNVFCGAGVKVRWDEGCRDRGGIGARVGGFSTKVEGTLTTKNAGGNHSHPTYMLNPQWHLRIHEETGGSDWEDGSHQPSNGKGRRAASRTERERASVVFSAQGPREVPLNVTAVWSSGERVVELAQKEVVTSSGAYTYGHARAAANMAAGDYTVILSAFEPQTHLGAFTLKVESSRRVDVTPIPQEGAGMYSRVSKGDWGDTNGLWRTESRTVSFRTQSTRSTFPSNAQFGARLPSDLPLSCRLSESLPLPCFSLLHARNIISGSPLGSSGPYSDALPGVDIPVRTLSAGKYWLVPIDLGCGGSSCVQTGGVLLGFWVCSARRGKGPELEVSYDGGWTNLEP
ncbi:hypothetical protein BU15DRAFT_72388 [Melanogaster broomeanus]|nr:hypothetical protein BU15DRAFT_72388 [Melanogaster broomeanus]